MSSRVRFSLKGGFRFSLAVLLFLPVVAGANAGKGDSIGTAFSLSIHNNRITARIDREPLHEVLTQLARRFSFLLHFHEATGHDVISAQLREATLEEAIGKLLVGQDYAMVKSRSSRREASSDSSLVMLFVLPRDTGSQSQHHPNLEPRTAVGPKNPVAPIADSGDRSNQFEPAKIDKLGEDLLLSDDPLAREAAAELLADLNTPEAGRLLSQALRQDLDEFVRETAAKALGDSWDPQHLDALTEALFNDPDVDVRAAAAEAMGEIGKPEAISALQKALDDRSPEVRESAVQALGDFADPQAISLLRRALFDPNAEVRRFAAYQLETLRGVEP
jgi:hypothetical protein